ncbi:Histone-lysine N-methyltransferase SETMAR-like [Oopsacas minuta]|uniref:Histone-lysine N-methyltransferase SETMAR-like n=1 Tax=Oopsacas minuta TaxID=111878 RepID=A0AAV7KGB5_9METZ|nr:Histone-lysine N-methyltransferase SETMAR-like [Oopsacas minuta]
MELLELFPKYSQAMRHGYTTMIQKRRDNLRSGSKKVVYLQQRSGELDQSESRCGRFSLDVVDLLKELHLRIGRQSPLIGIPQYVFRKYSVLSKNNVRSQVSEESCFITYTVLRTREFLENYRIGTLPHPPYSPDLAPCDFWLFPKLKDQLRGRRFFSNEELTGALFLAIEEIPKEEWKMCFDTGLNA